MQFRFRWILGGLLVLSLVLAACGGDDEGDDTSEPTAPPAPTSTTAAEPTPEPDPAADDSGQTGDSAAGIDPAIAALLPDAPAPPGGDFRSDAAAVVGATGRPQLLEFFTFW